MRNPRPRSRLARSSVVRLANARVNAWKRGAGGGRLFALPMILKGYTLEKVEEAGA